MTEQLSRGNAQVAVCSASTSPQTLVGAALSQVVDQSDRAAVVRAVMADETSGDYDQSRRRVDVCPIQ